MTTVMIEAMPIGMVTAWHTDDFPSGQTLREKHELITHAKRVVVAYPTGEGTCDIPVAKTVAKAFVATEHGEDFCIGFPDREGVVKMYHHQIAI